MTRAQQGNRKSYCSEPLDLIENYQQALAENFKGWDIHHRLEIQPDGTRVSRQELKDNGLYYERPANELVFMRHGEHRMLHNIGNTYMKGHKHSEESRKKNSLAHRGKHASAETRKKQSEANSGENNPFYGKHHTKESRQKIAEAHRGKHHSAEHRQKIAEAFTGMLWWNDGVSCKHAKECPGPEWKPGRILKP